MIFFETEKTKEWHGIISRLLLKIPILFKPELFFSFGLNILCYGIWPVGQVRGTGLCPIRSEPLWACLQVEFQFPGPSEVFICPSRREYWYKGKDRPLHFTGAISVPPGPCQAVLGALAGSELQSPHHQCLRALLRLWTPPALGPPVLPHASNTEFKLPAQVEKDPDGLLPP